MITELRLSLDWELWVVEHLLFTGKRDDLIAALVTQGIAQDVARPRRPPRPRPPARPGRGGTLAERLQRLEQRLRSPEIAVRPDIDAPTLLAEHWIPSRPVKLTAAMGELRALSWTLQSLAERFGDAQVEVNVRRNEATRAADTEQLVREMPFADLVARALPDILVPPSRPAGCRCGSDRRHPHAGALYPHC